MSKLVNIIFLVIQSLVIQNRVFENFIFFSIIRFKCQRQLKDQHSPKVKNKKSIDSLLLGYWKVFIETHHLNFKRSLKRPNNKNDEWLNKRLRWFFDVSKVKEASFSNRTSLNSLFRIGHFHSWGNINRFQKIKDLTFHPVIKKILTAAYNSIYYKYI